MDLSDDSSRGSNSKSSSSRNSKSRSGNESSKNGSSTSKSANSSKKAIKSNVNVTQELIDQFCAITGSTSESAQNVIKACNGNLEMAINMHMEEVSGGAGAAGAADEDYVRAPIPQKQEVLVQPGYEGYGFGFKGKRRIIKSVFDSFRNFEVETKLQESRLLENNGYATPSTSGPSKRTLEDIFRPPIDLMFKGNLLNARDMGVSLKKWLVVNIQNVSEFACQCLNRDVWSNPIVKNIIRDNFLFLQLYMDSEEGQRFMNFYKIKQWPYVAVLDPRTGELMVEWNYPDCATYITVLTEFVNSSSWGDEDTDVPNPPPQSKRRRLDTGTILDASEDEQLEAAIKASLAENADPLNSVNDDTNDNDIDDEDGEESGSVEEWFDSESESRTSEPKNPHKSETHKVVHLESAEEETNIEAVKTETELEPDQDWEQHLGPETDLVSSIVFRYPDGNKEQKSFTSSSSILALCKYVAGKGFRPDKYELMANFPKRLLLSMDGGTTLKDAGLFPHDTIFVQAR